MIRQVPTDVYAVVIAFMVLVTAQIAVGANTHDWRVYGLALANSFLVAAAAGHIQNKTLSPPGQGKGDGK
ncbi:hypothetical protein [Paenibacillus aestuarii]|uniref:Holin n=1 Tax=Paenibacillus aestuarii TaxID=516965 RepID=A0ABW0K9P1_9BACL|nr:hypothetical protein [Paenibacillus aestuarii]